MATWPAPLCESTRVGLLLQTPCMAYQKPYLTVDDQLSLLKKRGMRISDESRAKAYLYRIGYYRLSGYWYPFRQSQVESGQVKVLDDFRPGSDFSAIGDLYVFDKKLRLLTMDAIERIEIALRVSIALRVGRYGGLAHRDPEILNGKFSKHTETGARLTRHQEWLQRVDDAFARSKEEFAKHFKTKYPQEHPPIWISVELWDFGTLSVFFSGLKKTDKDAISSEYGLPDGREFESWLRSLNFVRNLCAHHSRLWNRPLVNQPKYPKPGAEPLLDHLHRLPSSQTRFYGAASIARFLLLRVNPTTSWGERLAALTSEFPANGMVNLSSAGFPDGWRKEGLWRR